MSTVQVIPIEYKDGQGDFAKMIKMPEYQDALFLFNDDETRRHTSSVGRGNAVIREYNSLGKHKSRPRSAGIVTGTHSKGYASLTPKVKQIIHSTIEDARQIIQEQGYRRVFYSADKDGKLGTGIFKVGRDVIDYITSLIKGLDEEFPVIEEELEHLSR
jgi:hypothetical protein